MREDDRGFLRPAADGFRGTRDALCGDVRPPAVRSCYTASDEIVRRSRGSKAFAFGLIGCLLASPLFAQAGDAQGEEQPPVPSEYRRAKSPPLSADAERDSFRVADGFEVELVASEPLIHDPVACVFDEAERLWVVEMRGYMPNVDGEGEREAVGSIAVLEDTDGDGRMDKRVEFLGELVLPRSVAPCRGGALVIAPPHLLFCEDTDGDGVSEKQTILASGLGGIQSPEHAVNGLVYTLDNSFRPANHNQRWRYERGSWISEPTAGGGQWGVTRDDAGRVFYNTNSDPLRGDLYPSIYARRNPNLGRARGTNVRIAPEMAVWPSVPTPGVNRGYRPETLRDDGTLAKFTAACAPHIYRASALGEQYRGNAFVCEPAGNLIKRYVLEATDELEFAALDPTPGDEFLTSTDERFRPVHLADGPDGGLYVVDMYRGVLQHRIFLTSFLRKQIVERELDAPVGYGRIWRIVAGEQAPSNVGTEPAPTLAEMAWDELIAALGHPDGWWRDTAQRLIVEELGADAELNALMRAAFRRSAEEAGAQHSNALERVHLLWALHGTGGLRDDLLVEAFGDRSDAVVLAAVRCAEATVASDADAWVPRLQAVAQSRGERVRHQVLLSLGSAGNDAATSAALAILSTDATSALERDAAVVSVYGRESSALLEMGSDGVWERDAPGRKELAVRLARCVARSGDLDAIESLIAAFASKNDWRVSAIVSGWLQAVEVDSEGDREEVFWDREPAGFIELCNRLKSDSSTDADALLKAWVWDGKPGWQRRASARELNAGERESYLRGRALYSATCAACHQESGLGEPGKAPPLRRSPWVLGSDDKLVRILMHGLAGPIEVRGERWDADMPQYPGSDEELADVVTYLRRAWGHEGEPVTASHVGSVRDAYADRRGPWSVAELSAE